MLSHRPTLDLHSPVETYTTAVIPAALLFRCVFCRLGAPVTPDECTQFTAQNHSSHIHSYITLRAPRLLEGCIAMLLPFCEHCLQPSHSIFSVSVCSAVMCPLGIDNASH